MISHKTNWDAAQRTGSRGIFVWESTDLVNFNNERLVVVEDATAGMVWAPEAIWDASKSESGKQLLPSSPLLSLQHTNPTKPDQYLVHWASKFVSPII